MTSEIKYDDPSTVPENHKSIIYKLSTSSKKIYDISPELSTKNDYPILSLGFQQYLHANVNKMELIREFEGKKKVYTTMHLFDKTIDDYEMGIENVTIEYFKFDNKKYIRGNGFYKLWELLAMFDIVPLNTDNIASAHITKNDVSPAQATSLYRETFSKKSHQKDKHHVLCLQKPNNSELDKKFNIVNASSNKLFLDDKIIKSFSGETKKVDVVTAYGAPDWIYKITLEQDITKLVISEITCALGILSDNGSFVYRIFETFTATTCKLIYVLSLLFDETYLVKPLTSHASTSEKFIVCKGYKPNQKILDQFEKINKIMSNNPELNVVNIFPELELPTDFHMLMMCINTEIANKQIIGINKIIAFIKSQNYYGDAYTDERLAQINASNYWLNLFYPNKGDYGKMIKLLEQHKNNVVSRTTERVKKLLS